MKKIILFSFIALFLSACVKNEPAPVWLQIDEWTLEANPLSQESPGYLSHNFKDAWVYVDNKLVGVFEVPCKIPVMMQGENKSIRIYPTVRNNGISATKKIYPFVEPYEVYSDLVSGATVQIQPKTRYYSSCDFWIEDFENSSSAFDTDPNYSTASLSFESDPDIALSGTYGHVHLANTEDIWVGIQSTALDLPQGGNEVYLEIEYRNTIPILHGIKAIDALGNTTDNPYISFNAQSSSDIEWKKIYLDLKEILSYSTSAVGFKQYLKVALDNTYTSGDIYIDNIRLVYY